MEKFNVQIEIANSGLSQFPEKNRLKKKNKKPFLYDYVALCNTIAIDVESRQKRISKKRVRI